MERGKNLRVLIVHEIFYPDFSGGAEKILLEIIKRIGKFCKVAILTSGDPSIKDYCGIKTYRISTHRYLFGVFSLPYLLCLVKKFDIIVANTYHAALPSFLVSKLLNKPVILIVHGAYGWRWLSMNRLLWPIAIFLEKIIFSLPFDIFLFFSDFSRIQGLKFGARRALVIEPGIDIKVRQKPNKEEFVLFVGRIERQKGIDRLIRVAKLLPNIKFVVVGRGKIRKKPDNVIHLGFVSEKELKNLYKKAFVFFLPSRAETLGYSILEAMSYGCIIVSTVPLKYKGFYLEKFNLNETVRIFNEIYSKRKKYIREGLRNIEIIKKEYSWRKFIFRFIKLLNILVNKKEKVRNIRRLNLV